MGTMDGVMPIAERKDARARSIGLRFLAVFVALASLSAGANASSPALAATTTLNSCDEPAFRRAVLGGGTVQFGLDCPALALPRPITIPSTLDVTIDANGHFVWLDGRSSVRHFNVNGGRLTLIGVQLR